MIFEVNLINYSSRILDVLYELMSAKPKDEEDEDYFAVESEDQKPVMRAAHTMHLLAMHLSPEKLIPHLVLLNFCLYSITPINRRQVFFYLETMKFHINKKF